MSNNPKEHQYRDEFDMSTGWDGQYDAFQGQSSGFYDPTASQYNYGDASAGSAQHGGSAYPNFMTPADPYSTINEQGKH